MKAPMANQNRDTQSILLPNISHERINLHHLFIFYAVAHTGSFSKAAAMLNLTQPAVSIQINELENSLGTVLLHRKQRKLQITDIGQVVLKYAKQIFTLSDELISTLDEIKGLKSGNLILGGSTTPGEYVLPVLVGEFRNMHPGITTEITVGNTVDIIEQISEYKIDLAMVGDWTNDSNADLEFVTYVTDEIILVASPQVASLLGPKTTLTNVNSEGLIIREQGSATRSIAEECFAKLGIEPKINMTVGSNQAVKQATMAGGGIGVISKLGVSAEVKAGLINVLNIEDWSCHRPLFLVSHKNRPLSPAQKSFVDFLEARRHM